MLLLVGTFRFPQEKLPEVHPLMRTMIETTRTEDGCVEYGFAQDVLDPGLIHVKECWRDAAALDRHSASKHMANWRASVASLGIRDREIRVYEVGEPRRL